MVLRSWVLRLLIGGFVGVAACGGLVWLRHRDLNISSFWEFKIEIGGQESQLDGSTSDESEQLYRWGNLPIEGMGFVTGVVTHPLDPKLVYVRTDVGGAYRWDGENRRWIQLLDSVNKRYKIESLAIDPQRPDLLYVASEGDILKSGDRGQSWKIHPILKADQQPIEMDGNADWRWAGERLAVDPNNSQVLYFASRWDGLWRSVDGGSTWQVVDGFPTLGTPPGGLSFVVLDPQTQVDQPDSPTQTIYVGAMGQGIYRSEDGGQIWQRLAGGPPPNQYPQQGEVTAAGDLYVTTFAGDDRAQGGVWIYRAGQWTEVTPQPGKNYTALAQDGQMGGAVMVAEYPFSPQGLHRTEDGGQSWRQVSMRVSAVPWWPEWHLYTLTGDLAISPQDARQVWLTTGFGVLHTADITQQPSRWQTPMANLEELVVFVLRSPPVANGALVLSGVADAGGFRHMSTTQRPQRSYQDGAFSDTTGLDFSEADPKIVVRVGSYPGPGGRMDSQNQSAYSEDNGATWQPFGTVPAGAANGKVAVSATLQANGKPIIVWAPQGEVYPHRSLDGGQTWEPVSGAPNNTTLQLWFPSQAIASDRVEGNWFYLFKYGEATGGSIYRSQDGGATWERTTTHLPDHWIYKLEAAPNLAGEVWLSVEDRGLHRSSDAGQSFTPLAQIEQVQTFGFGQAAPGQHNPAVFVYGTIDGETGLFRSDDATRLPGDAAGATWVKVSTDQQRLSNVNYIEGDRQRFGHVYVGTGGRGIIHGQPNAALTPR